MKVHNMISSLKEYNIISHFRNNRVVRKIEKSIYSELIVWLLICLIIASAFCAICIPSLQSLGIFEQKHVSYENARMEASQEIQNIIDYIYNYADEYNLDDFIKTRVSNMEGEAYLVDNKGTVIVSGNETTVPSLQIDLGVWRQNAKNGNRNGHFFVFYPLLINNQVHYILQNTKLSGNITYSTEGSYMISGLLAVVVFFMLVFLGIRKKIRYIEYLASAVNKISKGDLNYQVTLNGNDELTQVAGSINEMEENLLRKIESERKEERTNRELITNLSHDFKTPVTIILGYIDILRSKQYKDEKEHDTYLETAYEKAEALRGMILKLFELIETGKGSQTLMRSEVNLSRLLRQIVLEHEPLAEERGISVTTDIQEEKLMVSLDLEKITSVMNNLMTNALKYCSEKGKIHVSLEKGESSVLLTISNTCSEMKEEDVENLFEKFYRGDKARNSKIEGNGIGLSIVKNIVELHDGKIWAEYANGEISFIIRLRR